MSTNGQVQSDSVERAFVDVYAQERWGAGAGSGEGSDPKRNSRYIQLLQGFIKAKSIRSVVDLGCGDWQLSSHIDWSSVDYTGIDVVPTLIDRLNRTYGTHTVRFIQGNVVNCDLPPADLAIAKDVLQHLPSEMILKFLKRLERFRYAILTNDRRQYRLPSRRNLWNLFPVDITPPNREIAPGGYRPLRLTEPPFNLAARELTRIRMWHSNGIHLKEVLLWENPTLRA